MTVVNELDLSTIKLQAGAHPDANVGEWCVMEAVAWAAGEPWTDRPQCVSPVIGAYLRRLNDDLDDDGRQELVPYIFKVIGTNTGPEDEERRRWLVANWMLQHHLPAWLDAAGLSEQAAIVRAIPEITSLAEWIAQRSVLRKVSDAAWKRRGEVFDPLRAKVSEAVEAEYAKKAGAAPAAVAVAAAVAAADAGGDRWAIYDAVYKAVKEKVKPVVQERVGPTADAMLPSALDLLDRMIDLKTGLVA